MIDPGRFDIEQYLTTVQGIGGQFPPGGLEARAARHCYHFRMSSSSRKTATDTSDVRLGSARKLYAASLSAGVTGSPVSRR